MSKLALDPVNIQYLASAPTTPTLRAGDMYFDTIGDTLMMYDGTKWSRADSTGSYQTIPTATGTTVFTLNTPYVTFFTGTAIQTVTLPIVTTLTLGATFTISNQSTGIVTVNSSGANLVLAITPKTVAVFTCILITGATAASWDASFTSFGTITGTGANVLATSPTLVTPALGTPSAVVLTSGTGLPISTGVSGLGTGVSTLLAAVPSGTTALVGTGSPTITTPTIATVNGGGVAATPSLFPDVTTGTIAIGAGLTTGTLNIDAAGTGAHTTNVATGVTVTGVTKAVNVGTAGASGSTTNITIGSATAGALGTTAINGTTAATTVNIGVGATLTATTKAIAIGTNGVSGSTTNITIGSSVSGALGTTNIYNGAMHSGINANVATAYTFVLADDGKLVTSNNASAQTLSIPTNASVAFPIGTQINVMWLTGAGQPSINAVTSGTTTVLSTGTVIATPKVRTINSLATAMKIATDIWVVTGDIA